MLFLRLMDRKCTNPFFFFQLFLVLMIIALPASAQVSVTATAGTPGPTAYTTLKGAFDAVNAGTHQGNITISINGSTTETATATLNASGSGSASYTAVLIRPGGGANPVVGGSISSGPVVKLNGANNVTINGSNNGTTTRNLTITNTSTSSSNVLQIGSAGTTPIIQVIVKNTFLINGTNTSTAVLVGDAGVAGSPGYFRDITLQNNSIQKAYIGIYMYAVVAAGNGSGSSISGNDLNFPGANALRLVGIYCQGATGVDIRNNNIGNFDGTNAEFDRAIWLATAATNIDVTNNVISNLGYTGTSSYAPIGINISPGVTNSNILVQGNTITGLSSSGTGTTMGIFSYSASSGVTFDGNKINNIKNSNTGGHGAAGIILAHTINTAATKVFNNFIWDIAGYGFNGYTSGDNGNGITVDGGGGYSIDFNTVVLTPNSTLAGTGNRSSALLITSNVTAAAAINLRNNILANLQTIGDANSRLSLSNLAGSGAGVFASINYNDYYSLSSNLTSSGTNASITTTLAQVQAAMGGNANSQNVLPVFAAPGDLHLAGNNPLLIGKATPVSGIGIDIDRQARDPSTPDIGADEYFCSPVSAVDNVTICANLLPYTWNGQSITAGGTAVATYMTPSLVTGCDSTTTLNLTVNPVKTATENITICAGALPYTWNGQTITAGGTAVAAYTTPSLVTGCDSTTTLNLTVNPLKTATVNVTICASALPYMWNGQTITAGGTAVATYTTPSLVTGCDSTTILNLVVNPLVTATETITICTSQLPYAWNGQSITAGGTAVATYTTPSLVTGCDSTTTLNLIVNQPPAITAHPVPANTNVGGNATFTVTASGTALTYQWEVNAGSGFITVPNSGVYSNAQTAVLTITVATLAMNNYSYRCIVSGGCTPPATSNSALLTVTQLPQTITFQSPSLSSPLNVTYGDPLFSAAASASSGLPVTYTSNNTSIVTVDATGLLTFKAAGSVVITIEQSGNAGYLPATPLTLSVQVNKKDLYITADNKTRPYGEVNPVLTFSASGFVNGESLTAISSPAINTVAAPLSMPGNYSIDLTGGSAANYNLIFTNGTFTVTGAVVNINRQPVDQDICQGQSVTFEAGASPASLLVTPNYQWQQSTDGTSWNNISSAVSTIYTANANSSRYIRCEITAPGTTIHTNTAVYNVRSLPYVRASKAAFVDCALGGTQLNATGATSYQWTPAGGLTSASIANPVANPGASTNYVVEGFGSNGCSAKDSVQVDLKTNNYPVANAFTPNSDGKNDCFGIRGWGVAIQKIEFSIFNRSGVRVFYTNDANGCWDGRFNGVLQPAGVFVYTIKAVTGCGLIERKGTITLIR